MKKFISVFLFALLTACPGLFAQNVRFLKTEKNKTINFVLENSKVRQSIVIKNNRLVSDTLQLNKSWANTFHRPAAQLISDAGFSLNVVWTGLRAPGKENNAANPVQFSNYQFSFDHYTLSDNKLGKQVNLFFKGTDNPFILRVSYSLAPGKFYSRRQIAVSDPKLDGHFLDRMNPREGKFIFVETNENEKNTKTGINIENAGFAYVNQTKPQNAAGASFHIIKTGGFGQPAAFSNHFNGGFIGLEYPTGTTMAKQLHNNVFFVNSFQYFGERIENKPVKSNWEVVAVTPQPYVKKWFFNYVKDIRVAPAKPYLLYNSWYDLRSSLYAQVDKKIPQDAVMNQKNTLRIIRLLRKNLIEKYHIHLNAFVLDDGWDNYQSAWALNRKEFPNGLKPIADTLAKTHTALGLWFGPMGGYSFAMKRVKWMGEHGYEVTGHKYVYGSAKLCLAGKNYSALFQKRTTGFVRNDHVGYFKWDGIQFSCSNPAHGHPVGIYSRRAVMQSVIAKCNAVRAINPNVYLNITTGTWLSPWWLQYANQIWMDAADYAFSDVPSIHGRDNAMTYRDYALYNDFKIRNMWIPTANLMTHGIIKGRLENISKGGEPMDRFTNNAVLYFARGITMWELYISPDILTPAEWDVLSQSIKWAKASQDVMATTYMIGGNPAKGDTYGYVHFKGDKGLIAVRNPKVTNDTIRFQLKPAYGLNENAANLVVEQIYPYRRILPEIYSAGGRLAIPLDGFETALFNVFPMQSTNRPLLAGAVFSLKTDNNKLQYEVYETGPHTRFLQPQNIQNVVVNGKKTDFRNVPEKASAASSNPFYHVSAKKTNKHFTYILSANAGNNNHPVEVALLLYHPGKGDKFPVVTIRQGTKMLKVDKQSVKGQWAWYSAVPVNYNKNIVVTVNTNSWNGKSELWINNDHVRKPFSMQITLYKSVKNQVLPPLPFPSSENRQYMLLKKAVM